MIQYCAVPTYNLYTYMDFSIYFTGRGSLNHTHHLSTELSLHPNLTVNGKKNVVSLIPNKLCPERDSLMKLRGSEDLIGLDSPLFPLTYV